VALKGELSLGSNRKDKNLAVAGVWDLSKRRGSIVAFLRRREMRRVSRACRKMFRPQESIGESNLGFPKKRIRGTTNAEIVNVLAWGKA